MSRFLRPEDLRRLARYDIAAQLVVEGYLSGHRRSRQRGSSIEFHDYRAYSPGDDPALVDWRLFARTDRPYLRTFELETTLECHVLLDSSASMGFAGGGQGSKLEYASFFAACLAWLVVRDHDRVSMHLFDEKIRRHFAPGSTRQHLHELTNALETNAPGRPTNLPEALRRVHPMLTRRGALVVLSDFYAPADQVFAALNPFLHRGFRIHLFHVISPDELELPDAGLVRFEDMEDASRLTVHTTALRDDYRESMRRHVQSYRRLAASRRVDYALARTDGSFFTLFDRLSA